MKKILFAAQNMQIGGVQKALVNMLKTMPAEDDVRLVVFGDGPLLQEVPGRVKIEKGGRLLRLAATPFQTVLHSKNILDIGLRCLLMVLVRVVGSESLYSYLLRKHATEEVYDAAISYFMDVPNNYFNQGTNQYVAQFVNAKEKLAWIHTDPIRAGYDPICCEKTYAPFDRIVCVSRAVQTQFHGLLPQYADKTVVCHNKFPVDEIRELAGAFYPFPEAHFNIVTVGRVDNASKRMDEIIRMCQRLKADGVTGFRWHIIGTGPDSAKNQLLAKELGVDDVVCFTGEQKNPFPYIKHADLFALYSAYEGYPMVIGEAIALETKILTINYAAAKEQVTPQCGVIAESDAVFYLTLKTMIQASAKKKG